jgi:DNA topoisomerase-1
MAEKKVTTRKKKPASDTTNKQLVIVESPAKAKTLNKYLGPDYVVMASVGHVRDLPNRNPKGVKDPVPGVNLEDHFKPTYEVIKGKSATVLELRKAAKNANEVWLATDLDREGEAIAWHLVESLNIKPEDTRRVVFNAITRNEVQKAFRNPRKIDMGKVNAQQARRILDRIVGYQVSPLLWKKVGGGLSAGRVQSVAVRLVVDREREIEAFLPEEYWKLTGYFTSLIEEAPSIALQWAEWLTGASEKRNGRRTNGRTVGEKNTWLAENSSFSAELIEVDGKKFGASEAETALEVANRAGFHLEERTEAENPDGKGRAQHSIRVRGRTSGGPLWHVKSVQTKRTKSRPSAPFITSSLQQAAANQLDFTALHTMSAAQALYEGVEIKGTGSVGLITYMRTDSTHLSPEAVTMAREYVDHHFGGQYLPEMSNVFASPNKSAQEAHEAIRPTDVSLTPDKVRASLKESHYKLYKLIWERFVACQMSDAQWDATTVLISGSDEKGELIFRANGRILVFDGHYRLTGVPESSEESTLPSLGESQALAAIQIDATQNFTSPPPRYTEASLVKKLEAEGIGRPSTYAQIIQLIQQRKYVEKIRNRFHATDLGTVVTNKLVEAFPEIIEVGYTRDMEQQLDDIEDKNSDWVGMLQHFYGPFKRSLDEAYNVLAHAKAETQPAPYPCPQCSSQTVYRFGKKGRFLSCGNYPKCKYASPINRKGEPLAPEPTDIACPKCGEAMLMRNGRYGAFLSCARYPDCEGIVGLDKKGFIVPPKIPALLTSISCPKCNSPLNLRQSARSPWLSCSTFPRCRGRLGWTTLDNESKKRWEKALEEHRKTHPQPIIRNLKGIPVGENYKPKTHSLDEDGSDERNEIPSGETYQGLS